MVSWQLTGVAGLMRATRKRAFRTREGGHQLLARPKGPSAPPRAVTRRLRVTTTSVDGFDVHRVSRPGTAPDAPVVVYLHGGAYVSEIVAQHWSLVAEIATALDAEVWVPVYGLAPEHTATEAHGLVAALLEELYAAGRACCLAGDSAGGGLALAATQLAVARGRSPVRGLTLIAPWLDLGMRNPEVDELEPHDPWLARPALRVVADAWRGDLSLDDPRVSPILGDLAGLPPVETWVGTRDITLPDCRLLRDRLAGLGEVAHHELPGGIHVVPLLPVPEARPARERIVAGLGRRLGVPA
ncbi:alpha/beta hydrolase fold domain-containing protein [Nocardioides dongkuii]|uniref:alpha/beta hydrolase fold domain-containing protein n=1 Tax=Nocardioides dongkuii TaxID=2760089 RepID=UPI0015FD8F4E|nr:alpha/beta hydrolase [Nocardioides dongkuii]